MGVYRRRDKGGKHYGPYIVQYPYRTDSITGKAVWTTCSVRGPKRLAKRVYQQKAIEWERKKHLKLETKKQYTFSELLEWYLDHPKAKRKKTYRRDLEMGKILRENFGARSAREIRPTDIEAYQDQMLRARSNRGRPYKPATVNRFVTLFKRIYNLAIRDDMVEKNPCWKVRMLPERNVRDRIVSPEEFEILKNQLPGYALILSLGYYLGMREGEILNLKGKQIHFFGKGLDEGYIELYNGETKSGEGRMIPFGTLIGKLLNHHLTKQKSTDPERFLFTTGEGNILGNFRRSFQRACKRAGIKGLCFHDFRHTAITNMRKAEVNISVIMAISGHKNMAMYRRYNRVNLSDGREVMRKLQVYLQGISRE